MCKMCSGHGCHGIKVKALKPNENGMGVIKIHGSYVTYYKNGNAIVVKMSGVRSDALIQGIAKCHEGDKFKLKLGVKTAMAKSLKKFIAAERAAFEDSLKGVVSQYDSLVDDITRELPDTKLKRIKAKRNGEPAATETTAAN